MFVNLFNKIYFIDLKMLGLIVLIVIMSIFEYRKYVKKRLRENEAIYSTIKGEITDYKIINRPYYTYRISGWAVGSCVKSRYLLIVTIKTKLGKTYNVSIVEASSYDDIQRDKYLDIGKEVNWKVKKYPDEDFYVLIEKVT